MLNDTLIMITSTEGMHVEFQYNTYLLKSFREWLSWFNLVVYAIPNYNMTLIKAWEKIAESYLGTGLPTAHVVMPNAAPR